MKKIFIGFLTLGLLLATQSCKDAENEDATEVQDQDTSTDDTDSMETEPVIEVNKVVVVMNSKSNSSVTGTITLTESVGVVGMVANINGLTEGTHAIHIHQNGDCSSDDGTSAGGHWNPTTEDHGKWGDDMHHSGDIGNLEADSEGNATLTFSTDKWCIGCDDENKNVVGKSFIVHASADDFESQPSGAAGARVACGVIE